MKNTPDNWQRGAVTLAFLVQFAAIAYWGGSMNNKMDGLQRGFRSFRSNAAATHQLQRNRIGDLRERVSATESRLDNVCAQDATALESMISPRG